MMVYPDNDSYTSGHGPYLGGSHFLYLFGKLGNEADYSNQNGRIMSPTYRESSAVCLLELFYYINGYTGEAEDGSQAALGRVFLLRK